MRGRKEKDEKGFMGLYYIHDSDVNDPRILQI
jgi:hypothetical protein